MSCRLAAAVALVSIAALVIVTAPAIAATYYVSPSGSDGAPGTSQASPWRTVGRVNAHALAPGDTVLFEGGATFGDATLQPPRSGTSSAAITFSSYGSGRATIANSGGAVWIAGRNWLTFDRLRLTSAGGSSNVFGGSSSGGSTHITLSDSIVTGTTAIGVIAPTAADANWTIAGNTITGTGDSGVIMLGGPHTITRNTISDTGGNTAISYGKHGIYAKGPDQTISYNDFSQNAYGQAISIRFHGARVFGNTIHDTSSAIGFFDYDTGSVPQGTSYVYGNRAWNLTDYAFYYSGESDPAGRAPSVDFVVASNTFQFANASSEGINVSPSGSAQVTLVNNVLTGSFGNAVRRAASTVEHHNLVYGASANVPTGAGDLRVSPSLTSAPEFAPNPGSPVIDAGTTSVSGLTYSSACDGTALSYCGSAPDIGAVETAVVGAVPLAPPSSLAATTV